MVKKFIGETIQIDYVVDKKPIRSIEYNVPSNFSSWWRNISLHDWIAENYDQTIFEANNENPSEIILKKDIPDAWSVQTTGYTSLENINNLYDETDNDVNIGGISYGGVNFDKKKINININNNKTNLYNKHNKKDDNYYEVIKNKLNERKNENLNLNNKTVNEYKKNDTAGYGIFDKLNINYPDGLLL